MIPSYQLDDVVQMASQRPATFKIPHEGYRTRIVPGDYVKLFFRGSDYLGEEVVERMWVEVTEITTFGYIGRLDNDPTQLLGVNLNERVEFLPKNISDIDDDGEKWEARANQAPHSFEME